MVQWLRLLTSTAEGMGSILVGELTSHMPRDTVRKKKKEEEKKRKHWKQSRPYERQN